MSFIKVAEVDSVKENHLLEVEINQSPFLVYPFKGQFLAVSAICPHQGASLAQGILEEGYLVCPMHGKRFSCEHGKEKNSDYTLKPYVLDEKDGYLYIDATLFEGGEVAPKIKTLRDLPSPKGKFITGHLSEFNKINKHQVVEQWVKEVGDLFLMNLMGKKFVVSANPTFNGEVLKQRPNLFTRYSKIKEVMDEMGIHGVFSAEGEQWKRHRKITAEALSLKHVKGYFPIIHQMTARLLHRWNKELQQESSVLDVQKEMMLYTVDITTFIAFGYDVNTLESTGDIIQDHLKLIFPMVNKRVTAPFPLWRYFKTQKDKELDAALLSIQEKVNEFITSSKAKLQADPSLKETPSNFLEALLVEQEKEALFTDKDIFGNVFTMLLAGEDTTSNSISWAIYYLALHPELVQKVRAEVRSVIGDNVLVSSVEELEQLKFTEAIALETLRIKPTTPTLIMTAIDDIVVQDLLLPKGIAVLMQNKVAQTDEQYFSDPDSFKPERWLPTGCPMHNHTPDVIRVFGAGARFCPGKSLAIYEMKMAIAMVCQNFDLSFKNSPDTVKEVFAFTLYPENLLIKLNPVRELTC